MESKELFSIIEKYQNYVELGIKTVSQHFEIEDTIFLAYRKGRIPKELEINKSNFVLKYHFHGVGCLFVFDNKFIVDCSFRFKIFDYKGFDTGQILRFIKSLDNIGVPSRTELEINILGLVNDGLICVNSRDDNVDIYDFFIPPPLTLSL